MKSRSRSTGTGRFLDCYANGMRQGHVVFIEVKRGPSGCHFTHCPLCGLKIFLTEESGWRTKAKSLEEVQRIRDCQAAIEGAYPVFIVQAGDGES